MKNEKKAGSQQLEVGSSQSPIGFALRALHKKQPTNYTPKIR